MLESVIEKDILTAIRKIGVFAWNKKSHIKTTDNCKGVSDILGIFNGKMIAIEVKNLDGIKELARAIRYVKKHGEPSKKYKRYIEQYEFIRKIRKHGGIAFFSASVEHTARVLNRYKEN